MSIYSKLARSAVENYIRNNKVISLPSNLPSELLKKRAGVFVTIEKKEELVGFPKNTFTLRGCIGTYLPTRANIALEIIYNAIAAATEDPRFFPVTEEELPSLTYTVYILYKPELVKRSDQDISLTERNFRKIGLDPKKYGIIVKSIPQNASIEENSYLKTGLLLPDLEGIDTVEKQFSIACQKGNINPYKEKILIYRFKTEKYGE